MRFFTYSTLFVVSIFLSSVTSAACSFDVEVGDYLKFSTSSMTAEKSCETISINMKHTGKLPAKIMGHNWVLTKTADVQAVAMEGMRAGLVVAKYVPPGDSRVIAVSDVIGGGESTTLVVSTASLTAGDDYTFFCSFPGHSYSMRGKFQVI